MLDVVIDFSIEDDPKRPVLVGHRLVPRRQVDDTEAAMGKADRTLNENACVIRAAVPKHVPHAQQECFAYMTRASAGESDTANAAHMPYLGAPCLTQKLIRSLNGQLRSQHTLHMLGRHCPTVFLLHELSRRIADPLSFFR